MEVTRVPETTPSAQVEDPRYKLGEFADPSSVARWLNSMPNYRFLSMEAVTGTNHFSHETETLVWVIAERCDP